MKRSRKKEEKNKVAYLVGGMEKAPKLGSGWRNELTPFLEELGFSIIDPVKKETNIVTQKTTNDWYKMKTSKKYFNVFVDNMRNIINIDLDIVEKAATHLVIYWDKYAAIGAGSQGEVTLGYRTWTKKGRPIAYLIVGNMPLKQVPGWILGCAQYIFTSTSEFKKFMLKEFKTSTKR
jgi:hypothetical protein